MRARGSRKRCRTALYVVLGLVLASATLDLTASGTLAQQKTAPKGQSAAPPPDNAEAGAKKERKRAEEPIEVVYAEHATVEQYDDRESATYLLEGNAHLRQEDVNLFADVVRMDQGRETAEATGNLRVVDPENVIVGDLLTADFSEGRITLTGNVRLVHVDTEEDKAKGPADEQASESSSKSEPKNPDGGANAKVGGSSAAGQAEEPKTLRDEAKKRTVLTCDRMHYYYDDKRAICVGNVVATQEDDTVYSQRAIYDEDADILTLTGDGRIERKDGSVLRFKGAVINLEEDTIQAEGMTNSILVREKKEKGETKPASEAPKPGAEAGAAAPPASPPAPP